jgi:hypothetical protein
MRGCRLLRRPGSWAGLLIRCGAPFRAVLWLRRGLARAGGTWCVLLMCERSSGSRAQTARTLPVRQRVRLRTYLGPGECVAGLIYKSFPVTGVEDAGDDLKVVGKCSDGELDWDGDVVSPAWMASAVRDFLDSYPAVRLQHDPKRPIGKGLEAWQDEQGATWLKSLIVDSEAKRLVKSGVLRAYSVGIADCQTRPSPQARRFEIYGGRLAEVSVCDSPSNARCGIKIAKSVGGQAVYVGKAYGKASRPGKASRHGKGGRLDRAVRQAERADELDVIAGWLDSPDPAVREQAGALLGRGQVVHGVKITKSGKVKVAKGAGRDLAAEAVYGAFLWSSNPQVREMVLAALGGGHDPG